MVSSSSSQLQRWTIRYFKQEAFDGYAIIFEALRNIALCYIVKFKNKLLSYSKWSKKAGSAVNSRAASTSRSDDHDSRATSSPASSLQSSSPASRSSSLVQLKSLSANQFYEDDNHPTTLHYSFVLLSKMMNASFLYIPGFSLSVRLGMSPSRLFVIFSYCSLFVYCLIGIHLARFVVTPSLDMFVAKMSKNLRHICVGSTLVGQFGYIIFGLFNCAYILYQRQFLQNFIYHRCSILTLARAYQRRQIVNLYIAFFTFTFLSAPLFSILALIHDLRQPDFWPWLDSIQFMVAKLLVVLVCSMGAMLIGAGGMLIPLITCYLIVSTTKHLKNLVKKQANRYNQSAMWTGGGHNKQLESLLNSRTRKIMRDFACETLTMDWPDMIDAVDSFNHNDDVDDDEQDHQALVSSVYSSSEYQQLNASQLIPSNLNSETERATSPVEQHDQLRPMSQNSLLMGVKSIDHSGNHSELTGESHYVDNLRTATRINQNLQFATESLLATSKLGQNKASCLLFLYKNLIKNMSELKCIILDYERKFGNFHQVSSLLSCLIVSLWVTSALTEVRLTGGTTDTNTTTTTTITNSTTTVSAAEHNSTTSSPIDDSVKSQRTAYTFRILTSTITFILSNVFIFLKCDCLSDRIIKTKSQLFKMNIDLACTLISARRAQSSINNQQPMLNQAMSGATPPPPPPSTMPQIKIHGDPLGSGQLVFSPPQSTSLPSTQQNEMVVVSSQFAASKSATHSRANSVYEVDRFKDPSMALREQYVNQCPELDQIWSLYDQVERISTKVNFKFTSETYYSKRCMLLVFGRGVSLILFFIQIIDMYSN